MKDLPEFEFVFHRKHRQASCRSVTKITPDGKELLCDSSIPIPEKKRLWLLEEARKEQKKLLEDLDSTNKAILWLARNPNQVIPHGLRNFFGRWMDDDESKL